MNVGVVGGRDFDDYSLLCDTLDSLDFDISFIISGGAKGADFLGEKYAMDHNIPARIFKPDWKKYGRGAGFVRNKTIVENSDIIVAFWDGKSKGTKNTIETGGKAGVKVIVIRY